VNGTAAQYQNRETDKVHFTSLPPRVFGVPWVEWPPETVNVSRVLWPPSPRINITDEKIRGFNNLPVGWHYGEGVPPSDSTIKKAIALNMEAGGNGFTKTNAFPGIEGEIQFTVYKGQFYLEFTLEVDGTVTFLYEEADEEKDYQTGISFDEALNRIREFK
jgi:hypothetical protein